MEKSVCYLDQQFFAVFRLGDILNILGNGLHHLQIRSPHILHALRNIGNFQLKEYHVRQVLRKNHIPVSSERIKKGLPWRTFVQGLKSVNGGGVIYK